MRIVSPSLLGSFHHSGPDDFYFIQWPVLAIPFHQPHPLNHPQTTLHSAKDRVLAVQPRSRRKGDKKLTAVGVRTAVRHAQDACASMFQVIADLVFEFLAVDGASSATSARGITGLDHEVRNDAMEDDVVIVASLRKSHKVFAGLGGLPSVGDRAGFRVGGRNRPWEHGCCRARR